MIVAIVLALGATAFPISELAKAGACTDLDRKDFEKNEMAVRKCFREGDRTTTKLQICVSKTANITSECAGCYADAATCIAKACDSDCEDADFDRKGVMANMKCRMCIRKNRQMGSKCSKAFFGCAGKKSSLEMALATDQCTSAQDMDKAEGLAQDIPKCMRQSQTAAGIAACIEADGFTAGCADCVGTYGACVIDKCGSQCEADPTGAACKTCYTDKCLPAFYTCSGFPRQPSAVKMSSQERLVMRMMRTE